MPDGLICMPGGLTFMPDGLIRMPGGLICMPDELVNCTKGPPAPTRGIVAAGTPPAPQSSTQHPTGLMQEGAPKSGQHPTGLIQEGAPKSGQRDPSR
eukprot:1144878-Prorocentrum_minimum.AAC.1